MKTIIQITFVLVVAVVGLTACGQKGPLIIDTPTASGESVSKEVTDKDPVLNTQTQETATTR